MRRGRPTPPRSSWARRVSGRATPSSRIDPCVSRGTLRGRGFDVGDHIAILMENNRTYLEVAWAAQRAGLYYTAINTHLRRGEVQYILDDCGAKALVSSESMASLIDELDLSAHRRPRVRAGRRSRVRRVRGDPRRHRFRTAHGRMRRSRDALLVGHDGSTKGVRKQLAGTPLGDPSAPPVQIAQVLGGRGSTSRLGIPVAGADVPQRAARDLDVGAPARRHRDRDGALRSASSASS